jgi:hypothetical protein
LHATSGLLRSDGARYSDSSFILAAKPSFWLNSHPVMCELPEHQELPDFSKRDHCLLDIVFAQRQIIIVVEGFLTSLFRHSNITVSPDTDLLLIADIMTRKHIRRITVIEAGARSS